MSRIYVCDFCHKHESIECTILGERWNEYLDGLYGMEACRSCWKKLYEAFFSSDEVKAIKQKNIISVLAEIGTEPPKKPRHRLFGWFWS